MKYKHVKKVMKEMIKAKTVEIAFLRERVSQQNLKRKELNQEIFNLEKHLKRKREEIDELRQLLNEV